MKKKKWLWGALALLILAIILVFIIKGCVGDNKNGDVQTDSTTPNDAGEVPQYNTDGDINDFWDRFNENGGEVKEFDDGDGSGDVYFPEE